MKYKVILRHNDNGNSQRLYSTLQSRMPRPHSCLNPPGGYDSSHMLMPPGDPIPSTINNLASISVAVYVSVYLSISVSQRVRMRYLRLFIIRTMIT